MLGLLQQRTTMLLGRSYGALTLRHTFVTTSKRGGLHHRAATGIPSRHDCPGRAYASAAARPSGAAPPRRRFVTASDADRARLLDPFLEKLRPKQAEEYRSAIDRGGLHDRAHSPNLKDQIFYEGTPRANGPAPAQPLNLDGSAITPIALTVKAPSTGLASNTSPRRNFSSIRGEGDDE